VGKEKNGGVGHEGNGAGMRGGGRVGGGGGTWRVGPVGEVEDVGGGREGGSSGVSWCEGRKREREN